MPVVNVRMPAREQGYEIKIGAGLLSTLGNEVRTVLGKETQRIAVISNDRVFTLFGQTVLKSLRADDFTMSHWLMKEGEQHKTFRSLESAMRFLSKSKLERSDAIIALGGGVVGDLAGFAAATYLRGIAFIQVPTTLLAQIDSSVGGKTGINLPDGKNRVGAFHQPRLVLIDTETLRTLPPRELTSGQCEMVKQGAVSSRKLFNQTINLLRGAGTHAAGAQHAGGMLTELQGLAATIASHCRFKASITAGDERENINRNDRRSRRILNFGHTTAHALEAVTNYRRFRHGEAVGYGMLVAGEISKSLGMLPSGELELLGEAVARCGPLPPANDLSIAEITRAMTGDKKAVAGSVKWILLERIGSARIVDGQNIDPRVLRSALQSGLGRS